MYFNIQIVEYLNENGELITYRFVPKDNYNKIVVDKLRQIDNSRNNKRNKDIGSYRLYNNDRYYINETKVKLININKSEDTLECNFEHMNIPVGMSNSGNAGIYNLILPSKWILDEIYIIDPYKYEKKVIEERKQFKYNILWDEDIKANIIEMELKSCRGSFSFIIKVKIKKLDSTEETNVCRTLEWEYINKGVIGLEAIGNTNKSLIKTLCSTIWGGSIIQPNICGIGLDIKELFK